VTMGRRVRSVAALTDDDARVADPPDARLRDIVDMKISRTSIGVIMMMIGSLDGWMDYLVPLFH
jgi:hypothetical protein